MAKKKRPPHRPTEFTKEKFLEAVDGSGGFISAIASRLGCSIRHVHNLRDRYDPEASEAFETERTRQLDYAEGKLQRAIRNDNMTAIIFYLKTQGKARGYIERQEQIIATDETIGIEIVEAEDRAD